MKRFDNRRSRVRGPASVMSSSSLCSNHDLNCDSDQDQFLNDDLVADIERFAAYAERLRRSLDSSTSVPDGESMCVSVHSALSMVSQSVRDLLVRYPIFKTSQVLLPASQLVHSVKELNFDNSNVDASRTLSCLEKLEAAVGNTLKQSLRRPNTITPKFSTATLGRKTRNSIDGVKNGRVLTRRHSTYQPKDFDIDEMDRMVADRADGIDIAFDRGKAWSKYCKELLNFVSRRVQLELDHAKKVHSLANQSKLAINEHFLPLRDVFESSFDNDVAFCEQTYDAVKHIQDRFIKSLEMRRDDHERQRRALKSEWMRVTKQVKDTQQELLRARSLLGTRDDGYRRAQESFIRTESTGPAVGAEVVRRRKELERRRKNEEEAFTKREEAQSQVEKLEGELERREQFMEDTKVRIVGQLRELVYRCDQTTKACSTHYFQALANLWVSLPGKYHEFADATRTYTPGAEYMSFLQNLPHRTVSSGSLFRAENEEGLSSANNTASSSSVSSQRRNAIDVLDHEMLPERKPKKSSARLLEQSTLEGTHTEAAKSHRLQRIRQPTKCAHCEALSILSTVQCTQCSMVWHKSCLTRVSVFCGQSSKALSDCARRMSIFGVPLKGHLDGQHRKVPLILEKCVDELQRRGLKVKGIYRTCGVKSKIEHICEEFERSPSCVDVDLSVFHPMNIASVVKLYLRKLPEPLLTQELYNEWISLAGKNIKGEGLCVVEQIRNLLQKLPLQNFDTLRFLLLHLNRVTWFEVDNLMTASNLGAVISPSMIWVHPATPSCSSSSFLSDAHLMSKAVELLIKNAFEVFDVDRAEDWRIFFQNYPDIEEPATVDPEIEAHIGEGEGLEEDDLLDDDADVVCTPFMPQPPTPDLLKNTSRGKNESYSTSDDIDLDSSLGSMGAVSGSISKHYSLKPTLSSPDQRVLLKPRMEKKRSYTTSILVSPRVDRKPVLPQKQQSIDDANSPSICSDDVTIDVAKGQFLLADNNIGSQREVRLCRKMSHGSRELLERSLATRRREQKDSGTADADKLCLQSVGVLFSGTDVSYV
uniref:Rho GTPase-activating protein 29 n=2 Tax=Parascaris univalens TaxID=6257 RepID=A0A914ZQJ2_PARUN